MSLKQILPVSSGERLVFRSFGGKIDSPILCASGMTGCAAISAYQSTRCPIRTSNSLICLRMFSKSAAVILLLKSRFALDQAFARHSALQYRLWSGARSGIRFVQP